MEESTASKQTKGESFLEEMMPVLSFERQKDADLLARNRRVGISGKEEMDFYQFPPGTHC